MNKILSRKDQIDHIKKCEFHNGVKSGVCPTVSIAEADTLRAESEGGEWKR